MSQFVVEPLRTEHERVSFRCGDAELDTYLQRYARQNAEAGISRTFVAVAPPSLRVAGYYSLAASSVEFATIPDPLRKRLPRYPIPALLLGRLATDLTVRGLGLGSALLIDAGQRALRLSREAGIRFLEVEARDAGVRGFYERFGAVRLLDAPEHLVFDLRLFRAR